MADGLDTIMAVEGEDKDKDSQDNNSPEQPIDYKAKFEALDNEHKRVLEQIEAFKKFTFILAKEFHDTGLKLMNTEDNILKLFQPKTEQGPTK